MLSLSGVGEALLRKTTVAIQTRQLALDIDEIPCTEMGFVNCSETGL